LPNDDSLNLYAFSRKIIGRGVSLAGSRVSARVVRAIDGDTLVVLDARKTQQIQV
jgi:endonuclease YncB( thermonuclease family)